MGRGKSKAKLAAESMPLCTYGAACARKDCIFRHAAPKKAAAEGAGAPPPAEPQSVCMAHVAGACSFGRRCRNAHPPEEELEAIRRSCALRRCLYGDGCTNGLCLFLHPADAADAAERASERALERLALREPSEPLHAEVVEPVDNLLPERARPAVAIAPAPAPLPLHARAAGGVGGVGADVRLPDRLWIDAALRDAGAFHEREPLRRFALVNACHGLPGVLDLHFQSAASAPAVLDATLDAAVAAHGEAWVLTGSGHHVPTATHQARGGVLFEAVGAYLAEAAPGAAWRHAAAKDRNGHFGAYRVWAAPPFER